MKKERIKYSPYVYLVLDDEFYENDVIDYYNACKNLYNNSYSFRHRVIASSDQEVKRLINEFLNSNDTMEKSLDDLKKELRKVKNIILITENARTTKSHIRSIDNKVDRAIEIKNKQLRINRNYFGLLEVYTSKFMSSEESYDDSVIEFKQKVKDLTDGLEKVNSSKECIKVKKKISKLVNIALSNKAIKEDLYLNYYIRFQLLFKEYKNVVINDEQSFIEFSSNLKSKYEEIRRDIIQNYPSNIVKKTLKKYDSDLDSLIDSKMNISLHDIDEDNLLIVFDNYYSAIMNIENEIKNYDYYDSMTEDEKFNIKRQLFEEKNRFFKRSIRNFNKNIRLKYSVRYASKYINDVNKRADKFINMCAKDIGMPIPKNPWFIRKYLWADTANFVSDFGIKMRKIIHKPLQKVVRLAMKNKLVVEEMPKFDKDKQYVFVSTHYFTEDVIGLFSATPRQTHMLMGTTDQIENNPLMAAAMLFGFFHVDRMDSDDRKECLEKQNLLIDKGTSFINYIGGSWENSENELQPLSFSGAYRTSKLKDVLIIPVASYLVREDKKMYMRFGEPIDVRHLDENKANEVIRETLAMMHYKQMSKYSYLIDNIQINIDGKEITTHNLPYNQHVYYMNQIGNEYWNQPWTKPFAKEEIGVRKSKHASEEDVYGFISNLSKEKLIELSSYLSDVMVKIDEKERYDIVKYLDSNYSKFKKRSLKKR